MVNCREETKGGKTEELFSNGHEGQGLCVLFEFNNSNNNNNDNVDLVLLKTFMVERASFNSLTVCFSTL